MAARGRTRPPEWYFVGFLMEIIHASSAHKGNEEEKAGPQATEGYVGPWLCEAHCSCSDY